MKTWSKHNENSYIVKIVILLLRGSIEVVFDYLVKYFTSFSNIQNFDYKNLFLLRQQLC